MPSFLLERAAAAGASTHGRARRMSKSIYQRVRAWRQRPSRRERSARARRMGHAAPNAPATRAPGPGPSGTAHRPLSRPYIASWKVREITSSCCSRVRLWKFTA